MRCSLNFTRLGSSRTRLTKDLQRKPGRRVPNLEVAPRKRDFPRDFAPHAEGDRPERIERPFPSFRRGRANNRTGKWESGIEHHNGTFSRDTRPSGQWEGQSGRPRHFREQSADRKPFSDHRERRGEGEGWEARRDGSRSFGKQREEEGRDDLRSFRKQPMDWDRRSFSENRDQANHRDVWQDNVRDRRDRPSNEKAASGDRASIGDVQKHLSRQQEPFSSPRRDGETSHKPHKTVPIITELSDAATTTRPNAAELATKFTSPPLMPGLLSCLTDIIGRNASPTPIQALSLKWLLNEEGQVNPDSGWKQFLLASETGSGKSIAYLLPTLQTEYVSWTGGNKLADIERRIRRVWAADSSTLGINGNKQNLSKVLIFCNRSNKVDELSVYLEEQGIKNIGLSSTSEHRKRGSNHHLDGFLRIHEAKESEGGSSVAAERPSSEGSDPKVHPHVMITTSLLSRGLDFSPQIKHVFIVDEPRNMIDFLHRAGRAGRAGEKGKVVVFGKMKGRGSSSAKDVRQKATTLRVNV
ncbi:hypothetical protein H0H87_009543 [Tephrocybe sp. NHM501043]|nr:hypothetical protein H0H87_009543 [Tephrocybe sp. NHM501043]